MIFSKLVKIQQIEIFYSFLLVISDLEAKVHFKIQIHRIYIKNSAHIFSNSSLGLMINLSWSSDRK